MTARKVAMHYPPIGPPILTLAAHPSPLARRFDERHLSAAVRQEDFRE
jgi:hypothetical protein